MKKQSNLSRLLEIAGSHKYLTYASWVLSAISALIGGSLDLDENFYGDQDFDMEDFDREGFDIGGDTSSPYEEEKF